jgi:hypothetical protein
MSMVFSRFLASRNGKCRTLAIFASVLISFLGREVTYAAPPDWKNLEKLKQEWFDAQPPEVRQAISEYKRGSRANNSWGWDNPALVEQLARLDPTELADFIRDNQASLRAAGLNDAAAQQRIIETSYYLGKASPFHLPAEFANSDLKEGCMVMYRGEGKAGVGLDRSAKELKVPAFISASTQRDIGLDFAHNDTEKLVKILMPVGETELIPIPNTVPNPNGNGKQEFEFVTKPSLWKRILTGKVDWTKVKNVNFQWKSGLVRGVPYVGVPFAVAAFADSASAGDCRGATRAAFDIAPVPVNPVQIVGYYEEEMVAHDGNVGIALWTTPIRAMAGLGHSVGWAGAQGSEIAFGWTLPRGGYKDPAVWSPWR